MKVWVFQTGEPLPIDSKSSRPMRAINLCNSLIKAGHEVVLWSSDFNHVEKNHRSKTAAKEQLDNSLEIRLIASPGYKSHIGIGRLLDHLLLAINLKFMLKKEVSPDVAFVGYPPIESAWVLSNWLKKRNIPFILDVKDQWPHIFIDALPVFARRIGKLLFSPYFWMMKLTFRNATGISSVTQEFLDWCLLNTGRSQNTYDLVAPLTSPKPEFSPTEISAAKEFWDLHKVLDDNQLKVYFVGSFSEAFDFDPVFLAAKNLPVQFILAGDGPKKQFLIQKASLLPNVILPGWISTAQAEILAERSSAAIAPLKDRDDFNMSLPNKFLDALSLGKPMLTSNTGYAGKLLKLNHAGVIYGPEENDSLESILQSLLTDSHNLKNISKNATELYFSDFDFKFIYESLVSKLERLSEEKLRK